MKHGRGTLTYPNGDVYEGEFQSNRRHGHGTLWQLHQPNGSHAVYYSGEWADDAPNGVGSLFFASGERYDGQMKDWKRQGRHGSGIMQYSNGDVFSGEWRNNLQHGPGTHVYKQAQRRFDGEWHAGVPIHGELQPTDFRAWPSLPSNELANPQLVATGQSDYSENDAVAEPALGSR